MQWYIDYYSLPQNWINLYDVRCTQENGIFLRAAYDKDRNLLDVGVKQLRNNAFDVLIDVIAGK